MELRHLRYFVAVALEENITKAAERLHVSQPGLSRQVRDLEEELGVELLERTAKSVSLTEAGRVFLEEASAVLERLELGVAATKAAARGGRGEIHVGYAPSLTAKLLSPTIRAFQAALPKVKVKLHDVSSAEMRDGLRDGSLDFAFMVRLYQESLADLSFVALKRERIQVAMPVGHALANGGGMKLAELGSAGLHGYNLVEYPEYGDLLRAVFATGGGRAPKLVEEHESVASLIAAVEAGMGLAVVTESLACVASGRVTLVDLLPEPEALEIGIAWAKERLDTREALFLEKAKEVAAGV